MKGMVTKMKSFLRNEEGVTAIEYGLIAGLFSVVIIGVLITASDSLLAIWTEIDTALGLGAGAAGGG